ncbi:MAG: hypothetical protein AAFY50_04855 [Cyanobacteria bacterium J06648_1]
MTTDSDTNDISSTISYESSNTSNYESTDNNSYEFNSISPAEPVVEITPCPSSVEDPVLQDESIWTSYADHHGTFGSVGNALFHGGQDTFLENKEASEESPQQECSYDSKGNPIDQDHEYSGMGGSANYHSDSYNHTFNDPGGIWERGGEGFATSMEYYYDSVKEAVSEEASALYADSLLESAVEEIDSLYEDSLLESAVSHVYDSDD